MRRSLYECSYALVQGEFINCGKGHPLPGSANIRSLMKGKPLQCASCQQCTDFNYMGPPVPEEERGWLKEKVET